MGGIVVAILAFFVILYYWSSKNDDIWEDETFKRLFPKSEKINMQIIYIMAYWYVYVWKDYEKAIETFRTAIALDARAGSFFSMGIAWG